MTDLNSISTCKKENRKYWNYRARLLCAILREERNVPSGLINHTNIISYLLKSALQHRRTYSYFAPDNQGA